MSNVDVIINRNSQQASHRAELSLDELAFVSAGKGKSGGKADSHPVYLQVDLKDAFVSSY